MKLTQKICSLLGSVLWVVLVSLLGFTSCSDPMTTDKTNFVIYYTGMSDIGPSQSGTIAQPSYKGPAPANFAITNVTLDGETFTGNLFTIDANTGSISVQSDENTSVGLYSISISCDAGGSTYSFADIIQVNFLKAVPEGITVEPSSLVAEYADIIDETSPVALPTAQVVTDGDHISITGYKISNVRKGELTYNNNENPLFEVSNDGVVSIVRGCKTVEPAVYYIDLKLNTAIVGSESEEGLFTNALEVKVISKPLELTYVEGNIEQATEENPATSFASQAPVLRGSTDGVSYTIESVSPEAAKSKFAIDQTTGVISVAEGHGFKVGETYEVSVKVANEYCKEGVIFENAFKLGVVDYIEPISGFSYDNKQVTQAVQFEAKVADGFKGVKPRFEFVDLDPKYKDVLTIDVETGTVSAKKGHNLSLGQHTVTVKASNDKNSETAVLTLNVVENPNYFTYFTYGNNLGLDKMKEASQFRVHSEEELRGLQLIPESDIPQGRNVKWTMTIKSQMKVSSDSGEERTSIDENTGRISALGLSPNVMGIVYVKATVYGESVDEPEAYSITVPVFFHHSAPTPGDYANCIAGVTVEYTPFVFRVNPKKGGYSVTPEIKGAPDMSLFMMDYVRNYNYYNLNGYRTEGDGSKMEDGNPETSKFMNNLWVGVYGVGTGAKDPVSYYGGKVPLNDLLCYVDKSNGFRVQVNANKWYDQGWADGIFACQICCVTKGKDSEIKTKGDRINPIVIWLDKNME